ncbi:MAG: TOBE domain-containing protein, partial [Thermodesulfobacteriota bacterium]
VFEAPGVRLSLGERKDLDAHLEQSVHLGIRPEALAPVSGEGEAEVEARLELVESLGSEAVLHLTVGSRPLIAKAPPSWSAEPGSRVRLSVRPRGVHVFREGKRIGGAES